MVAEKNMKKFSLQILLRGGVGGGGGGGDCKSHHLTWHLLLQPHFY